MKNIHVLPTENESRLRYNSFNKVYELCEFPKYHTDIKSTHNIYITNDESAYPYALHLKNQEVLKINGVGENSGELFHDKGFSYPEECQKIILTTDQDLIKDGVQAIDDEFLEWFVKNPSCEDVEVLFACRGLNGHTPIGEYKIIIPKEEDFKHELHVMSKEEVLANRSNAYEFIDFDKQETLEEVAERIFPIKLMYFPKEVIDLNEEPRNIFFKGAKWQQEQFGKSEFLQKLRATLSDAEARRLIFEQFKNK